MSSTTSTFGAVSLRTFSPPDSRSKNRRNLRLQRKSKAQPLQTLPKLWQRRSLTDWNGDINTSHTNLRVISLRLAPCRTLDLTAEHDARNDGTRSTCVRHDAQSHCFYCMAFCKVFMAENGSRYQGRPFQKRIGALAMKLCR